MQQNVAAAGSNHIARVQFPEELPAADIQRPPSARPIPRVGSQNKVPTMSMPVSRHTGSMGSGEDLGRTRTPSFNSPHRSELGLGYPSAAINPSRRRSSAQQVHRKKDSTEIYDASRYDLDDAAEQYRNPNEVSAADQERLNRIALRKRRRKESHKSVERTAFAGHGHPSSPPRDQPPNILTSPPLRALRAGLSPQDSAGPSSDVTALDPPSLDITSPQSTTLRSDSPASSLGQGPLNGTRHSDQSHEEKLMDFLKGGRNKNKIVLTEEQRQFEELRMEENIARYRETAKPGTWERTRTAADQLQRRYALIYPSLEPGSKPFNLMDVMRWRRNQFEESLNLQLPQQARDREHEEIERRALSWRPHLSELHNPRGTRYRSRIYAPWHLTALIMEQYQESLKPREPPMDGTSPTSSPGGGSGSGRDKHLLAPGEQPRDGSFEYDSNQSGGDPLVSRSFNSLRRLRNSLSGVSKSVDLSMKRSNHQTKGSISSLNLFATSGSPSTSRAHVNRFMAFTPSKSLGEHSDEGYDSARGSFSTPEKSGVAPSRGSRREKVALLSTPERDHLALHSSEEDRSQRSSDEGKADRKGKLRIPYIPQIGRPLLGRDDTVLPPGSAPVILRNDERAWDQELENMSTTPDPGIRTRLYSRPRGFSRSQEARAERRRSRDEKEMEAEYENREEECDQLEDLIKKMNQEQYQLLQTGREYLRQSARIKEMFGLKDFRLLMEEDMRTLANPTTRSQTRLEAEAREEDFVPSMLRSEREAERLYEQIIHGAFAPPPGLRAYFPNDDDLRSDFKRLETIGWDLDYVSRVAMKNRDKSIQFEGALASLRASLGRAVSHSSQVYREILALETLVAASRPVPTWKRISNRVKPLLSWAIAALTWVLWFLGELGFVIGLLLPRFLKDLFGWEMLQGSWPGFVFLLHLPFLQYLRRTIGLSWSFEEDAWNRGWLWGALLQILLIYITYRLYVMIKWYTQELRHHVLTDWFEVRSQPVDSWRQWLERRAYGFLLLCGPFLLWIVIYLVTRIIL
ncbi:hypothetical protein PIIN_08517 [Serendipita indica DSM 11827]|uniref:Uncharacterized protein n=1 Tax=Serendipita indica (strain DSM 11827) TaxID=1109443 RepID=G4TTC2_SERID|nr:hypothetical protein PIIN_08517 [Serendipita indica DSM 11827]